MPAADDEILLPFSLPNICGKKVTAAFDGGTISEEWREPGHGEIGHVVCRVPTPPLVGQRPAATAKGIEKAVLNWHTPLESSFDVGWKPENEPGRGST